MKCTSFPCHAFDEHTDRHATGESMGIDNHVGLNTAFAERHVDGRPFLRAHALLPVARREFISNDG